MNDDCIFCKIVHGKIPCEKIYEDDKTFSFLDISPNNKGHALVIPKKHSLNLLEMQEEDLVAVTKAIKKVAGAISKSIGPNFNLVMNNGKDAGQVVFHAHIHVIPRNKEDDIKFEIRHLKYEEGEMKEFANKIRKHI